MKIVTICFLSFIIFTGCDSVPASHQSDTVSKRHDMAILPGWEVGTPGLKVPIPAGYSTRTEKGHDFDVHYLEPKSHSGGIGTIYLGHNPNLFHRQLEGISELSEYKETIGGERVSVYEFVVNEAGEKRIVREAILSSVFSDFSNDKRLSELYLHISATAFTIDEVDRLWKCVSAVQHD